MTFIAVINSHMHQYITELEAFFYLCRSGQNNIKQYYYTYFYLLF